MRIHKSSSRIHKKNNRLTGGDLKRASNIANLAKEFTSMLVKKPKTLFNLNL